MNALEKFHTENVSSKLVDCQLTRSQKRGLAIFQSDRPRYAKAELPAEYIPPGFQVRGFSGFLVKRTYSKFSAGARQNGRDLVIG